MGAHPSRAAHRNRPHSPAGGFGPGKKVGMQRTHAPMTLCYDRAVNANDYRQLLRSLDTALQILEQNRTPDGAVIAAFDTLKQARARVHGALGGQREPQREEEAGSA